MQYKKVIAEYAPTRTDDLRPEALDHIGKEYEFMYAWKMDDSERWPGVWAMQSTSQDFPPYWVPEFDLRIRG